MLNATGQLTTHRPISLEYSIYTSELIDWCFTARQHKIGQFVPIIRGDYWLRRLRIANEEHTQHIVVCDAMNIHTQRQTTGMPYLLKDE